MDNLSCKLLEGGNVGATDVISLGNGVVAGTPKKFAGLSIMTSPSQPPLQTPVDSRNLGKDSVAGQAAALGKLQLEKCWGKVGPSI